MRRYSIILSNPTTGQVWTPPSLAGVNLGGSTWTSTLNGQNLAAAQNIELDIFSGPFANPSGNSVLTVWGISIQEIQQATAQLTGMNIQIFGGMLAWAGNPGVLASAQAAYYGLLLRGSIFPGYGNWIGTDMWAQMVIYPGFLNSSTNTPLFGTNQKPINLAPKWSKGTSLQQMLASTFGPAFPGVKIDTSNLSTNIVAPQDLTWQSNTLEQFSRTIKSTSRQIIGGNYSGAQIAYDSVSNTIVVFDGTQSSSGTTITINKASPKVLNFSDLIGQPTWLGFGVNFKTPMRSDITVGTQVTMPQIANAGIQTQQSALQSSLAKNNSVFQGTYYVTQVRHVGNFRDSSADAWCSVFDAVQLNQATT